MSREVQSWEGACLLFNPFEGDYEGSGPGDRILSDKVVKAKVDSTCHTCEGDVLRGSLARVRVEIYDDEFMRFRWCEPCCIAMATSVENPDFYEDRVAIGQEVRNAVWAEQRAAADGVGRAPRPPLNPDAVPGMNNSPPPKLGG